MIHLDTIQAMYAPQRTLARMLERSATPMRPMARMRHSNKTDAYRRQFT